MKDKKFLYAFTKYSKLKSIYDVNDVEKKLIVRHFGKN